MCPIKNLTERRRLPRLGKIRIGIRVESKTKVGVTYPKAVDYFVLPPEVSAVCGEKPTTLDIMFPVDNEETFASQFYRAYTSTRGLVCKGDGEKADRLVDIATKHGEEGTGIVTGEIANHTAKDVEWIEGMTCPGRECPYYQQKACKEIMNLQFLIPDVPGLGIWQLDTSSYNSIVNINSALALIRTIFGTVSGIPLLLSVEPVSASPEGKKKTIYVLNLRTKATLKELGQARGRLSALAPQLPSPDDETPHELFPTEEEEEARAEDEKVEVQVQAQKDTDAMYGVAHTVTLPSGHQVNESGVVVAKEEIIPPGELKVSQPNAAEAEDNSPISKGLQATILDVVKGIKLTQGTAKKLWTSLGFPEGALLEGLTQSQGGRLLIELRKLERVNLVPLEKRNDRA